MWYCGILVDVDSIASCCLSLEVVEDLMEVPVLSSGFCCWQLCHVTVIGRELFVHPDVADGEPLPVQLPLGHEYFGIG